MLQMLSKYQTTESKPFAMARYTEKLSIAKCPFLLSRLGPHLGRYSKHLGGYSKHLGRYSKRLGRYSKHLGRFSKSKVVLESACSNWLHEQST